MLKSQISQNGDFLRRVADWLDEKVDSAKQQFRETKLKRAAKIVATKDESKWDNIKYYFQQLHNTNKMAFGSLFEYMAKLANAGLVDNKILRGAEKAYAELKHDDKKFVHWLKKHPSISSYLSYYFMIAALSLSTTLVNPKIINRGGKDDKKEDKKEIIIEPNKEEDKYDENDQFGNKALFESSRSKVKFALAFVENYYPYIYWCGEAWTAGHGLTILYNADGTYKKVNKNTPVPTIKESDVYKGRYLTREILPDVIKYVKVPMDENTLIAACVLRYCIGGQNFRKSAFLKQLNAGKKGKELSKTLTGWRQQEGVLNRCYFFAALMEGKIEYNDLLYLRAEGCYNLLYKDMVVYVNGKPKCDKNGFYEWDFSNISANLEKAKMPRTASLKFERGRKGKRVKVECKLVKEIVPDYIWQEVSSSVNQTQKVSKIKSATDKTKEKDKKKAFAKGIIKLKNGATFDISHLFVDAERVG